MNFIKYRYLGPILFIIFTLIFFASIILSSPKILILHSYNTGYAWTDLIDKYLQIELRKRPKIRSKFFYMNTKLSYTLSAEKLAMRNINQYDPDLIIAIDDNAQKFLSKYFLDTEIPIVFAGVGGNVDSYNYNQHDNITGIFERKPLQGILFVLAQLNTYHNSHHRKNVLLLTDETFSAKQDGEYLAEQDWKIFNFSSKTVATFDEWKNAVRALEKNKTDYLLVSGYRKLLLDANASGKEKRYATAEQVGQWTQKNSPVKILAINVFAVQDGFLLSVGDSASEQAQVSIEMAERILYEQIKPSEIPYQYPQFYSIGLNQQALTNNPEDIPLFLKSFSKSSGNIF
jgi:hypothetical protein